MKKTLVLFALAATGFAFADSPATVQPQTKPQTPASQPAKATPAPKAEAKLVADKSDKKDDEPEATSTPTTIAKKAKVIMVADQKGCNCTTCPKKDAGTTGDTKEGQKPATAGKTAAPKIALA